MARIEDIVSIIAARAQADERVIVGIAGAPGAGKSTIAEHLVPRFPTGLAIVVPMDGFHYDDVVLAQRGLRKRKGAPETFDFAGFETLLRRIRGGEVDIAIPVFDRSQELSRAAASIIEARSRIILVEGNYLLLDEDPWRRLAPLFDLTVFIDVPRAELERRLLRRWAEFGRPDEEARLWVAENDMPNVDRVLTRRRAADIEV